MWLELLGRYFRHYLADKGGRLDGLLTSRGDGLIVELILCRLSVQAVIVINATLNLYPKVSFTGHLRNSCIGLDGKALLMPLIVVSGEFARNARSNLAIKSAPEALVCRNGLDDQGVMAWQNR